MSEKKPGVYLCKGCGIAGSVDVGALETVAKSEFRIGRCVARDALCAPEGVAEIKRDIDEGAVNRLVVGACSPRVMADRFRFDGVSVVRANLREQVAWSQPAGAEDTQMLAADQIRMAATQLARTEMLAPAALGEVARKVMVVGGGVTGLTAALEAARSGYDALIVEKSDALGGWSAKWSKRTPHLPPYRDVRPNDMDKLIATVKAEQRIRVMTSALVKSTSGQPGAFSVTIAQGGQETSETVGAIIVATGWRPYDATKLGYLGYGATPDVVTGVEFEAMLAKGAPKRPSNGAPARNIAFIQCAGSRDPDHLPYCSSVCCSASIKQALQVVKDDREASAYIVYEELRTPGTAEEFYREAQRNGVIFMKGKVKSVDGAAMTVSYADELLGDEVPLAGLDLIVLATGMVPNSTDVDAPAIEPEKSALQLVDDINPVTPIKVAGYADSQGSPWPHIDKGLPPGGPILNLQYRQGPHIPILADGFSDSHYICFPYETRRTGIHTAGPVRRPMDMAESAEDATGAVMKAIQAIEGASGGVAVLPRAGDLSYPKIGHDKCTKCRRCTVECPFGAIDEDEHRPANHQLRALPALRHLHGRLPGPDHHVRQLQSADGQRDDRGQRDPGRVRGKAAHPGARLRERRLSRYRHGGRQPLVVVAVRAHHSGALPRLGDAAMGLDRAAEGLRRHHADGLQVGRRLPVPFRQGFGDRARADVEGRRDAQEHDAGIGAHRLRGNRDRRFGARAQGHRHLRRIDPRPAPQPDEGLLK